MGKNMNSPDESTTGKVDKFLTYLKIGLSTWAIRSCFEVLWEFNKLSESQKGRLVSIFYVSLEHIEGNALEFLRGVSLQLITSAVMGPLERRT